MLAVMTIYLDNRAEEHKEELAVDVRRSQGCDFDDLLKVYLYYILDKGSDKKKELDNLQERIEKLELLIDDAARCARAPNANNQAQGEWTNNMQRILLTTVMPL